MEEESQFRGLSTEEALGILHDDIHSLLQQHKNNYHQL